MIRVVVRAAYAHDKKAQQEAEKINRLLIPENLVEDRLVAEAQVDKSLYHDVLRIVNR